MLPTDSASSGGFSTGGGSAGGLLGTELGAILGKFGVGASGKGKMAARGQAAAAAKAQRAQMQISALQRREDVALHAFEAANPTNQGQVIVQNPADKKLQHFIDAAAKVAQLIQTTTNAHAERRLQKKELKLQAKIAKRELAVSPQAEVRVVGLYGPNEGYWAERGAPPPAWLLR